MNENFQTQCKNLCPGNAIKAQRRVYSPTTPRSRGGHDLCRAPPDGKYRSKTIAPR